MATTGSRQRARRRKLSWHELPRKGKTMISRRNIIKIGAAAAIGLVVAGSIAISEARPKKLVKKGSHTGIYQQSLKHHKHAKHVLCDTKTGDVVWTFHDGNTATFTKGRLPG